MASFHPSPTGGGSGTASSNAVSDLPQSQIDAIIRTKRKAREPKACYPCHTRKVKCDRNFPCDGCVKRDHADLCSYERPSKKRQMVTSQLYLDNAMNYDSVEKETPSLDVPMKPTAAESSSTNSPLGTRVSIPREDWDNVCNKLKEMESTIIGLRSGLEQIDGHNPAIPSTSNRATDTSQRSERASPEREGIHTAHMYGEGTVHLGSRSVLAYILNKSGSLQAQALLEGGLLPKLGLDNETATYPFVDLWSSDTSSFDVNAVCSALPSDEQIKEFFYFYRDIAGCLYPVLVDVPGFEQNLETFLQNRAAAGGVLRTDDDRFLSQGPFGMSLAFIGLLFAVLASGCQSSDLPGKERELTSQVYVCCSYQCLRMCNFVSQPTLEAMKTLLIIGNVLSYNMNPGVSYVLLGMTLRMGIALGLHAESNRFDFVERYTRRHIWWSMAWQDSHFSLSYDRPSTVAISQPEIADRAESQPGNRDYFETMCRIIALTLEVVRGRMVTPNSHMSFKTIQEYKERIQKMLADAAPHLRDRKYCHTLMNNLERLALKVHFSYITSELCRPVLKAEADKTDPLFFKVRQDCVESLINTVESYIELHSYSSHGSRAWITLQRAISCAFLLAVIDEGKTEPKVRGLLHRLEVIIAERASAEDSLHGQQIAEASDSVPVDSHTQWAKPLVKSLRALQKLNIAFNTYGAQNPSQTRRSNSPYGQYSSQVMPSSVYTQNSSTSANACVTPNMGSLPPPTPESSSSGDWTIPNLLDRAAEYIHPPLWG
ncbi:putative C6 transcription factor [Talaromyces proteolyticus]|uniref:C6 transcription factor n=1 Tax=Talaromyces proteolyticus TaxID=1131652 RepID=A0AAD4KVG3_9EURO|nr:putative C6 transcription factor [Talaromyces proteolyticus]KAH8701968.1 putative C6 transcription factor [Talaromyces proteolyticus]